MADLAQAPESATFTVVLDKRALRELDRLPQHVQRRYYNKIRPGLEKDPLTPRPNFDVKVIEVKGDLVYCRVRIGDWRLAARVDRKAREVRGLYWY